MDYINETQDEDERVSRLTDSDLIPSTNGYDQRLYSGLNGFENGASSSVGISSEIPDPGPPPPLPPKIRLD